jgi:hypothetical protein
LRRGNNGDFLIAGDSDGDFVVVFGWTCNRLRLRNLFKGFDVVARTCGRLVSTGAWKRKNKYKFDKYKIYLSVKVRKYSL